MMVDLDALIEIEAYSLHWSWSAGQEAVLRQWYGHVSAAELAERVSEVLRRETGVPDASRSVAACNVRVSALAIPTYRGEGDELCLMEAARQAEGLVSSSLLYLMAREGRLPTRREGKQRYVSRGDLARWLVNYREVLLAQEEALEATEGAVISKRAAMHLCGLKESQFTRYLKTEVIRAWRVPFGIGTHHFWLVERASVEALVAVRARGQLRAYLYSREAYVAMQRESTAVVRDLRKRGRLGVRDPLTEPRSQYLSGCFTVAQVASHTGLKTEGVYREIERGTVKAWRKYAGGRWRYAIPPAEAKAFSAYVAAHPQEFAGQLMTTIRHQIVGAGLLTVPDLAQRWGVSRYSVQRYARRGLRGTTLRARAWSRHLVFEEGDVREFEAEVGL